MTPARTHGPARPAVAGTVQSLRRLFLQLLLALALAATLLAAGPPPTAGAQTLDSLFGSFTQISAGGSHTCAVTGSGQAYCWGSNGFGQVGDGTATDRHTPTPVTGLVGVTQISAGNSYTCAVTIDGQASCWGCNNWGQIGDGTTTDRRTTPRLVTGLAGATQISAGQHYTCAVTGSGQASCWGYNRWGQLGDGTTTDRYTPTPVTGLVGVTQITAGGSHTCAVTSGGQASCWGSNGSGRLGDGTTADRYTPTPVTGLVGVTQITAGGSHTCAVTGGGQASCWGSNWGGQVGDGTTTDRYTPTPVKASSGLVDAPWSPPVAPPCQTPGSHVETVSGSGGGYSFEVAVHQTPTAVEVCTTVTNPAGNTLFSHDERVPTDIDPTVLLPPPPTVDGDAPPGDAPDSPCTTEQAEGGTSTARAYVRTGSDASGDPVVCFGVRGAGTGRHVRATVHT